MSIDKADIELGFDEWNADNIFLGLPEHKHADGDSAGYRRKQDSP